MRFSSRWKVSLVLPLLALLALAGALVASGVLRAPVLQAASPGFYLRTNLVSDIPGVARFTDAHLVNPWGLSHSPTSPWWVSDNGTGVSTIYDGDGRAFPLVVTIPPPAGSPKGTTSAPTGNVFNSVSSTNPDEFVVRKSGKAGPSIFMFATEDGTISGWNPTVNPTHAILAVDRSKVGLGAVYKGLAIGSSNNQDFIYATNFRFSTVEMFDAKFKLVRSFTDAKLSHDCPLPHQCYAPFGIQNIGGNLYVTYALQDAAKHDDVAGLGHGFIDVFNTNGNFIKRLVSHGVLNSPWGLALAPANFGKFSSDLLVGNFGDGFIHAFNPNTGAFLGQLKDQFGNAVQIDDLWALAFGNGHAAGATNELFFTAGIADEAHGLFGKIQSEN